MTGSSSFRALLFLLLQMPYRLSIATAREEVMVGEETIRKENKSYYAMRER